MSHKTREAWLVEAVQYVSELFAQTKEEGEPVQVPPVRISCGFPAGNVRKSIGQCWGTSAAEDGISHVFVSPVLKDPTQILGVIIHELCHAIDDCKSGHKGRFRKLATQMGLEGKMTATHCSEALEELLQPIVNKLGEYPHAALDLGQAPVKKQTTRMLKASCKAIVGDDRVLTSVEREARDILDERVGETCGYNVRTTQKWLDMAVPTCPLHGLDLEVEEKTT